MHPIDVVHGYSQTRQAFSAKMSQIAYEKYYKSFWNVVERIPTINTLLDLKYGIDALLTTQSGQVMSIAERYREYQYITWQDLTIRCNSIITPDKLLEAKHLLAQFYIYGYANEQQNDLAELYIINIATMIDRLQNGEVKYSSEKSNKDGSSTLKGINHPI